MFLDDRKRNILRVVIDDYIDTAEPIGSRTIARKHELGLSSATIRNEMSDLEEMGFLAQPHTSAGRIPSDKGYRLYVDELMKIGDLSIEDIKSIHYALETKISELNQLIKQASVIMSRITKYTSMAITPQMKKVSIKAVQIVPLEKGKALVVVVTNAGMVKNSIIRIPEEVLPDYLISISNALNDKLNGLTVEQLNLSVIREIENEVGICEQLLMPVLNGVADCVCQIDTSEVFLNGTTNILGFPEYKDIAKAKEFLNKLDEKSIISRILNDTNDKSNGVTIQIGSENNMSEIRDCSVITATYSIDDQVIGLIGVIGPTRMEYSKVISSLNYIRKKINFEIGRLLSEGTE